jgi:hypothetical protein
MGSEKHTFGMDTARVRNALREAQLRRVRMRRRHLWRAVAPDRHHEHELRESGTGDGSPRAASA